MRQVGVGLQGGAEALSIFHQEKAEEAVAILRVQPMPKHRGAQQGNVDGPLECSLALGTVAVEAQ